MARGVAAKKLKVLVGKYKLHRQLSIATLISNKANTIKDDQYSGCD